MTQTIKQTGFSSVHIERLREKLSEWGNPSDSSDENGDYVDLWFVDADVLSVYINSHPTNYLSVWPSLYALGNKDDAPKDENQIEMGAKELMDSISIAVSYFLFGRFRETLTTQSRRFLLTPEHDRELDAMTVAVAYEAQRTAPGVMSALTAHYMELTKAESVTDSSSHIEKIFSLLREGTPSSKVHRTLDLRQRLLNTMQDAAFFPSDEPGTAFAFQASKKPFEKNVKALASVAFEVFMGEFIKFRPLVAHYAPIKEAVFAFHSPNRSLREYVDKILLLAREQPASDEKGTQHLLSEFDPSILPYQAKIAARQVSDVYALARLVALAKSLNENHRQGTRRWRVNLLSGSNMQRTLRENWKKKNPDVDMVRLVHPLSMMGIDGFAQPDDWHDDSESGEHYEESGGYALRALKQNNSEEINAQEFLKDFKRLLSTVAVSCAPSRERWMRNLRIKLQGLDQYSKSVYLKSVRDAISRDYVATFAQLNKISLNSRGQLPTVSLPALALPLEGEENDPSPAQLFVMQLHGSLEKDESRLKKFLHLTKQKEAPSVSNLIKADPTGYSAMLCVGLGYLAQGRSWLRIAEAVANTAVAFASTQTNEEDRHNLYPDGNEALFFAAFVSRMQVDGDATKREIARDWLQHHRGLMVRAFAIQKEWEGTEIGQRLISKEATRQGSRKTLAQLVSIRYESEALAADVFGHLIDRLEVADLKLMDRPSIECLDVARDIASRWNELGNLNLQPQYQADVNFVGAQLTALIIQAWLCAVADNDTTLQDQLNAHQNWIAKWVDSTSVTGATPGSMLVRVLTDIFNSRIREGKVSQKNIARETERQLDQMQFATLDELRVPLFKRLLAKPDVPVSNLFGMN